MPLLKSAILGLLLIAGTALAADKEPVWIDVRSAEEFAEGHIPGAVNVPHGRIAEGVVKLKLKARDPIYLYCSGGSRSWLARDVLRSLGYRNVTDLKTLENAREKWQQEQNATETATKTPTATAES